MSSINPRRQLALLIARHVAPSVVAALALSACGGGSSSTQHTAETASAAVSQANASGSTVSIAASTPGTSTTPTAIASGISASAATGTATSTASGSGTSAVTLQAGDNVMPITVNGSLCGDPQYQYRNEPCVSVKICQHGTTNCQTISNILLDTGSAGLRLFRSVVTLPVTQAVATDGGGLTECVSYTGASSDWGPVAMYDIQLAGEPAVQAPVQLIQSTYATPSPLCSAAQTTPDTGPTEAGFNGILGVSILVQDCGSFCTTTTNNGNYYSCAANGTCKAIKSAVQVQNPIALLPTDNNGVLLKMPTIAAGGAPAVTGSLIMGIGTQANNTPAPGVTTFTTDAGGEISTVYPAGSGATAIPAFVDSGSNTMIIPKAALTACANNSAGAGYLCPAAPQTVTATNYNTNGSVNANVAFQVGNATTLLTSGNGVFGDLALVLANAQSGSGGAFDWGLPFFFGRSIYFGFDATTSKLGSGPYYAY